MPGRWRRWFKRTPQRGAGPLIADAVVYLPERFSNRSEALAVLGDWSESRPPAGRPWAVTIDFTANVTASPSALDHLVKLIGPDGIIRCKGLDLDQRWMSLSTAADRRDVTLVRVW